MFVSVEKLIELGVMRKSMFNDPDWYVVYTADGAIDVSLNQLTEGN